MTEDKVRRVAPIPACIMYLPPKKDGNAFIRQLREDQYWKLVFPAFDDQKMELPKDSVDCTGRPLLSDWQLKAGDPVRGWPIKVKEGDIMYGAGGDRLKVVWLRSHRYPDGDMGGPIALARTMENFAETYGVGVLKGRSERMRLQLERMGPEVIVTATDEGCVVAPPNTPCESRLQVFLPRHGMLMPIADIPLERRAYAQNFEPGQKGRLEYKLTSAPEFKPGQIKIFEKIQVRDEKGRELRKAELMRLFTLTDDGTMVPNEPALWPKIYAPSPKKKK